MIDDVGSESQPFLPSCQQHVQHRSKIFSKSPFIRIPKLETSPRPVCDLVDDSLRVRRSPTRSLLRIAVFHVMERRTRGNGGVRTICVYVYTRVYECVQSHEASLNSICILDVCAQLIVFQG